MRKIAIVTDSNSGISQSIAEQLGVFVIPMPFTIDGEDFFEDINLTVDEFYDKYYGKADYKYLISCLESGNKLN